jgi:hypothetical protein
MLFQGDLRENWNRCGIVVGIDTSERYKMRWVENETEIRG